MIDFWSPWYAPCRSLRLHVAKFASEMAGRMCLVEVNVERSPEIATRFDVGGVPTLLLVQGGSIVHRFTGQTLPSDVATRLEV